MVNLYQYLLGILILFGPVLGLGQSSRLEQHIGASAFEMVKTTQGFYQNESLLNVVKEVGQSLEEHLEHDYDFKYYLVDIPDPNAFATAGGYVFVTRGLLALINSKDELAGILAHELSHVTGHHSTKRLAAGIVPVMLELPANLVGLLTYKEIGNVINLPIEATTKLATSAYSRSQEKEADKKGIELAIKAGYDPYGLVIGLRHLTDFIEYASGEPMKKGLYVDHPVTEKRVAYLTEILTEKGVEKPTITPGTAIIAQDGLIFGQNPRAGILNGNKFVHPDINLYCEFPKNWQVQNSPTSVIAFSSKKKATIMMGVDTSAHTPAEAAKKTLNAMNSSDVLNQEPVTVNGFDAYRATVRIRRLKYADYHSEIMWLKLPSSGLLLKVVGVSKFKKPDKSILESFASFRKLQDADLATTPVFHIMLKEVNEGQTINNYIKANEPLSQLSDLLMMLNAVTPNQTIPEGKYLKVLRVTSANL